MALFPTKVRFGRLTSSRLYSVRCGLQAKAPKIMAEQLLFPWHMKIIIPSICSVALLGGLLLAPLTTLPTTLRADDHKTYHDKGHNDDHEWNSHEDQAYRMWVKENHRKYRDFAKLPDGDRESYWAWRHEHSDAVLKIDIR